MNKEFRYFPIADRLEKILILGRDNSTITIGKPVKFEDLRLMSGWTIPLTKRIMSIVVHWMRTQRRIPICSSNDGYFLPRTPEEMNLTRKILQRKISGTEQALRAMNEIYFELQGKPIFEFKQEPQ